MTIKQIDELTIDDMEKYRKNGIAELIKIKEHDCYFITIDENFGYSVLVFKNGHHIFYVNDYQLHHGSKLLEELKPLYIDSLNRKLFTAQELMGDIHSYYEYSQKNHYLRNYWIMQYDHVSSVYIGTPGKELVEAKKNMFFCSTCFCYVPDLEIAKQAATFLEHIQKVFSETLHNNKPFFREIISNELANNEAGYTGSYEETLNSLNLIFDDLSAVQQNIVTSELNKLKRVLCDKIKKKVENLK